MRRRDGGSSSQRTDSSDRCRVQFPQGWHGQEVPATENKEGGRGDPVPGCILPPPASLCAEQQVINTSSRPVPSLSLYYFVFRP